MKCNESHSSKPYVTLARSFKRANDPGPKKKKRSKKEEQKEKRSKHILLRS